MQVNGNLWNFTYRTYEAHGEDFLLKMLDVVDEHLRDRPVSVLDVGCVDGGKAFRLAARWPQADITGVDISELSIAAAEQHRQASQDAQRIRFAAGGYSALSLGRYDLILADSVLQFIPGSTEHLFAKLTSELRPKGWLVFSMPYTCLFNRLLTTARRTISMLRTRMFDSLFLSVAKRLYGQRFSSEFLRERLCYMYLLPARMLPPSLDNLCFLRQHLAVHAILPYAHASIGQL